MAAYQRWVSSRFYASQRHNRSEVHKINERARDARRRQATSLCPRYLDLLYSSDVTIHYSAFLIKKDFCVVQTAVVHGCRAFVLLGPHAVAQGVYGAAHRVAVAVRGPELVERRERTTRSSVSASALSTRSGCHFSSAVWAALETLEKSHVYIVTLLLRVISIYYTLLSLRSVSLIYFKILYYR